MKVNQCAEQRKTDWWKQKDGSLRVLWNKNVRIIIHVTGVPERRKSVGLKKYLKNN